jgi:hypothetical protein
MYSLQWGISAKGLWKISVKNMQKVIPYKNIELPFKYISTLEIVLISRFAIHQLVLKIAKAALTISITEKAS